MSEADKEFSRRMGTAFVEHIQDLIRKAVTRSEEAMRAENAKLREEIRELREEIKHIQGHH